MHGVVLQNRFFQTRQRDVSREAFLRKTTAVLDFFCATIFSSTTRPPPRDVSRETFLRKTV